MICLATLGAQLAAISRCSMYSLLLWFLQLALLNLLHLLCQDPRCPDKLCEEREKRMRGVGHLQLVIHLAGFDYTRPTATLWPFRLGVFLLPLLYQYYFSKGYIGFCDQETDLISYTRYVFVLLKLYVVRKNRVLQSRNGQYVLLPVFATSFNIHHFNTDHAVHQDGVTLLQKIVFVRVARKTNRTQYLQHSSYSV